MRIRLCLLCVGLAAAGSSIGRAEELGKPDADFLSGLIGKPLFDPVGAHRVTVKRVVRSPWGSEGWGEYHGWLVTSKSGQGDRVYFIDDESLPVSDVRELKRTDFLEECRQRYAPKPKVKDDDWPDTDAIFAQMQRTAIGYADSDLALACWLHRLDKDDLAAAALRAARQGVPQRGRDEKERSVEQALVAELRDELAWSAFAGMVHAYMMRADVEALASGERLMKQYAEEAKAYKQAPAILAELKRRKAAGTFGKESPKSLPEGFDALSTAKKVQHWIDALDEVDARQHSQPGGVSLTWDERVKELIKLGDAAVPALIDTVEKDQRLTRSVHFWRDFSRDRTVLAVREAALAAVMTILRVRVFETHSTGDNFTTHGEKGAADVAAKLRAYWVRYGKYPFDERMMKVLTDPKQSPEAWREAAYNLGFIGRERDLGTMFATDWVTHGPASKNPLVNKFKQPTVAEAMLAALDRDLAAARKAPDRTDDRHRIEAAYLEPLAALGDRKIA
jgi:hypothetical protein